MGSVREEDGCHNAVGEWLENAPRGRWPGLVPRSQKVHLGTRGGAVRASMVRKMGAHERWDKEATTQVRGSTWQPDRNEVEKQFA